MELWQISDAAKYLGCTPGWVRYLTDTRALPAIRTPGGRRLLRPTDVAKFAKAREAKRAERAKASDPDKVLA